MAVPAKTIPNRFQLSKVGDKAMDTRIAKFNAYNNGEAITFERIKEFMEHLKEDVGLLPNTLRLYKHSIKQSVLKTFSHQSRDIAFVAKLNQVFAELKIPSYIHPIHEDEILTAKEVKKLITGLSKDGKLKLALVVEFLFSSGCRINEAMNIQVSHIKVKDDVAVIRISHNKQKHEYFKRIPVELYLEIKQVFQTKKYLFQNSRNKPYTNTNWYIQLNKAGRQYLRRDDVGNHLFRKSSATALIHMGKSLVGVSNFLNHSSVDTTAKFYVMSQHTNKDALALNRLVRSGYE